MRTTLAKSGALTTLAIAAVAICAGCTSASGSAQPPVTGHAPATASAAVGGTSTAPPPPVLPTRALASPGCTAATVLGPALDSVRRSMQGVAGNPFGVAVAPGGGWAFAAVNSGVEVLRVRAGAIDQVRSIPIPGGGPLLGVTISRDGRYLLAADDANGAVVISAARAEQGTAGAVLGTLAVPAERGPRGVLGGGAIEVAVSPDDRFAFVSLEDAQRAAVFNLGKALSGGFGAADYVGSIPLEVAPVGLTVSPDGRWLYATSEVRTAQLRPASSWASQRSSGVVPGATPAEPPGTLTVIDLQRAETDPAKSVVATVDAGCQPVRVITSGDGTQVWVTARASDDLLCFSAAKLATDPRGALVAIVRVGEAPVGLAAVRGGSLVVVADSNRFGAAGATSDLDVVDVAAALSGRAAVVGHIPAGLFPREMALSPQGTLLVSNYQSDQLEAVDVASIPGG